MIQEEWRSLDEQIDIFFWVIDLLMGKLIFHHKILKNSTKLVYVQKEYTSDVPCVTKNFIEMEDSQYVSRGDCRDCS